MIFGLPGAALAMYQTAKPEKKKQAGGLLLSAALACMATGITEPLEFSFLFVAPMLFAVQVILAGAAYMIAHILNIAVGLTFTVISKSFGAPRHFPADFWICSCLVSFREMQRPAGFGSFRWESFISCCITVSSNS